MVKEDFNNISKRLAVLLLAFILILPSVVKFSHAISHHHEHEVCLEKVQTYFHETNADCDFYKFKLNNTFYFEIKVVTIADKSISERIHITLPKFLKSHQHLTHYLRGPPHLT